MLGRNPIHLRGVTNRFVFIQANIRGRCRCRGSLRRKGKRPGNSKQEQTQRDRS